MSRKKYRTNEIVLERLRNALKRKGLKQKYIAKDLGTSASYLSQMLHGEARLPFDYIIHLREYYGISIDRIINGYGGSTQEHQQ